MPALELWIPITIAAAFLQNLRSVGQKHLRGVMGTTGATFVRFGFGLPVAACFVGGLLLAGYPLPPLHATFFAWAIFGAAGQIVAQVLLIYLFSFRNFAVGTAYSRTEPAQAALFGLLFLGETQSLGVLAAIAVSVIGVMLISVAHTTLSPRSLVTSMWQRNALIGIASGTMFGVASVAYRAASLSLGGPNFLMQSAVTLLVAILFQASVMALWMLARDRQELVNVGKAWKPAMFVGVVGATASFGWFTAMTLQQAAIVKALAQIEMIFTFASSVWFFKERILPIEVVGCMLIVGGILMLLVLG